MSKVLRFLGYILAAFALIGGLPTLIKLNFHIAIIVDFLIVVALSILCFWGSNRLKKK